MADSTPSSKTTSGANLTGCTIHIHCGDCSADTLRKADVPGEVLTWFDPVLEGPTPAVPEGEWFKLRATYLAENPDIPVETVEDGMKALHRMDRNLKRSKDADEVVLWFDACLFDMTILLHHLDWFSRHELGDTRLSLLCVGEFPGFERFRGLGELTPGQLASLVPKRREITQEQLDWGRRGWGAYRSPDPRNIETFLNNSVDPLPYVGPALHRHLERFPSVCNGLNRLQNEMLECLNEDNMEFLELFRAVSEMDHPPFFGDTYVAAELRRLATAAHPAVDVDDMGKPLAQWQLHITEFGQAVSNGIADWAKTNGVSRWLGGVHLTGHDPAWRWDAGLQRLK